MGRRLWLPCLPGPALFSLLARVPLFSAASLLSSLSAPLPRSITYGFLPTGVVHSPSPLARCAKCSGWRKAWLLTRRRLKGRSLGLHHPRNLKLHPLPHPSDPVCPGCPKDGGCPSVPPGLHFEMMLPSGTFLALTNPTGTPGPPPTGAPYQGPKPRSRVAGRQERPLLLRRQNEHGWQGCPACSYFQHACPLQAASISSQCPALFYGVGEGLCAHRVGPSCSRH